MSSFLTLWLLFQASGAVPHQSSTPTTSVLGPEITLRTGIFSGVLSPDNGTEKWLGIPYAEPPVGPLQFKAPVPVSSSQEMASKGDATRFGNACPQPPSNELGAPIAEDCLYLNVWRPIGTKTGDNLPVIAWIHGGAFTFGAANADPTRIIQRSVLVGKPLIFVSLNHRLNTFGFLASRHVPAEDLNAGLLDQRQALIFIQNNIAAFGGDPSKVTIWGQSAGAGGVEAHFIYPANRTLFRAGIAESSTGPFKTSPHASVYDNPGLPFSRLLSEVGCPEGATSVDCLRTVPFEKLLNISNTMISNTLNSQLWQPSIGPLGSLIPERASARMLRGDFLHLPYIGGTNANEGTTFSVSLRNLGLHGIAEDAAFSTFIQQLYIDPSTITSSTLNTIHSLYPANYSSLGDPFNTGDSLFDRAQTWYTEEMFLAPRRLFFEAASRTQKVYAYHFKEFIPGNDPTLGVAHSSELALLFGPIPNTIETDFANQFLDFYINFVHNLDPGPQWTAYQPQAKNVLQLQRDNVTMVPDDWALERTTFLNAPHVLDEFQK
ncbi:hypothetical protein AX16_010727 [Volvariella volvacea WC 439]|nr:hypothetical protein AX16_010727 [Volvariella volvacea WC 439]